MILFVVGVACVLSTMVGVAFWLQPLGLYFQTSELLALCTTSVLAPTLAAWGAVELLTLLRPRRLFDHRVRSGPRQFAAGLLAGAIGVCLAVFPLAMVEKDWHELLVLCGTASLGSSCVILSLRRVRAGACIHCGYDLRALPGPGQPGSGICPECGSATWPVKCPNSPALDE